MGEAIDRNGQVMGSATGATKAEVLAELERRFPEAEEIRLRKAREQLAVGEPVLGEVARTVDRSWPGPRTLASNAGTLEHDVEQMLNRHSAENASNTPDFILARFLLDCLEAWNHGVQRREGWYGRDQTAGASIETRSAPATDPPVTSARG